MTIKRYYKKKAVINNISAEYSSEDDMIYIQIERKLNNGTSIGTDYLKLHPSYIEPLYSLLKEVTREDVAPNE